MEAAVPALDGGAALADRDEIAHVLLLDALVRQSSMVHRLASSAAADLG